MAKGNLARCLDITLCHEGGYVDHPRDPGGATNMGITHITLADWRGKSVTKQDVKNLGLSEAQRIYAAKYWNPMRCTDLPFGVDLATFDFGVNSGIGRAPRYLQAVVGAKVDGRIGDETLRAVRSKDGKAVIQGLCRKRLAFLQGLKHWGTFKRGWSRRVADIEAKGVAMWLAAGKALTPRDRKELEVEGEKAGTTANKQEQGAGGAAGSGGIATGGEVLTSEVNWWLIGGIAAVALIVVAFLAYRAGVNRERERAYEAVAAST